MANFCTYCGRQLQDGEVCNCRQQANTQQAPQQNVQFQQAPQQNMQYQQAPQGQPQPVYQQVVVKPVGPNPIAEGFKQISKFLKDMINKPVDAVKDFMNAEDARGPLVLLAIQTIIYILYHIVMTAVKGVEATSLDDFDDWDDLLDNGMAKAGGMDYFQAILFPIIWTAVIVGVLTLLIVVLSNAFEKKKVSYKKALSFSMVPAVGVCAVTIITLIIQAIDNTNVTRFTDFITAGIGVFILFQLYFALSDIFTDVKNRIYAAVITGAVLNFVAAILYVIFDKFTTFYSLPF